MYVEKNIPYTIFLDTMKFCTRFLGEHISCDSWLLSPALGELLDNDSNILNFQKLFKLESVDYDNVWYMGWMFPGYDSADENLPECTRLQKRMKEYILSRKKVGSAKGELIFDYNGTRM